jgi:uncharacterized protein YhaN
MPGTFDQRIATIISKARLLTERYHIVLRQRDEAIERNNVLSDELQKSRAKIEHLESELNYLRMASTIEPSRDDIDNTREYLAELVWEIDKCINQLSN